MLIACKYEEIYVPKLDDFVDITDNTYTSAQILEQECKILKGLDFEITFPTVYRLLERYRALDQGNRECFLLACYVSELCLIDIKMNKWAPSRIASAALYLSKKMLKQAEPWPEEVAKVVQLTEKKVRECAREICILINLAHQKKVYEPIYKKYSIARYMGVAKIPVTIRRQA